ncbi:disulfide bond formation protein B [Pseudomonadota bacterium]
MNRVNNQDPRRLYPALLALTGTGALAGAYIAQYGFGYEPCILCLYQRIPYALIAILGFVGLRRPDLLERLLVLAAMTFSVGAALGAYHFGVEQHWWASATGCSGGALTADVTTADLLASLQQPAVKPCDAVDWTLLGVSMAGWNALFSCFATFASLLARRRLKGNLRP